MLRDRVGVGGFSGVRSAAFSSLFNGCLLARKALTVFRRWWNLTQHHTRQHLARQHLTRQHLTRQHLTPHHLIPRHLIPPSPPHPSLTTSHLSTHSSPPPSTATSEVRIQELHLI